MVLGRVMGFAQLDCDGSHAEKGMESAKGDLTNKKRPSSKERTDPARADTSLRLIPSRLFVPSRFFETDSHSYQGGLVGLCDFVIHVIGGARAFFRVFSSFV